ncbi:unnamed protein product, partial [Iphiclides podalirius]
MQVDVEVEETLAKFWSRSESAAECGMEAAVEGAAARGRVAPHGVCVRAFAYGGVSKNSSRGVTECSRSRAIGLMSGRGAGGAGAPGRGGVRGGGAEGNGARRRMSPGGAAAPPITKSLENVPREPRSDPPRRRCDAATASPKTPKLGYKAESMAK